MRPPITYSVCMKSVVADRPPSLDFACRVGTSFVSLSSAFSIFGAFYRNGRCEPNSPCPEAWGALLGTSALCSLTEIGMSLVPARALRRLFPPVITVSARPICCTLKQI